MRKSKEEQPVGYVNDGVFENFNTAPKINDWDLDELPSGAPEKLDIFDEMRNADLKNKDFFAGLDPKLQKQFSPLVAMRWFSTVPDNSPFKEYQILMTNEILNIDFWSLKDHPELLWKLMAICGTGKSQRHNWIAMPKRKKLSKVKEYLLQWYPSANDQELDIINQSMNRDEFESFVKSTGCSDAELRDILAEHDKESGFVPEKVAKGKAKKPAKG